jgi:DnaJ-class molecular chaperone
MKDYYKILELDQKANERDINHAYRQLSLKYHPDKNPDFNNPNEVIKKQYFDIQEAHQVLSDDNYRKEYDYRYSYTHPVKAKKPSSKNTETTETKYKDPFDDFIVKDYDYKELMKNVTKHIEELRSLMKCGKNIKKWINSLNKCAKI